MRMDSLLTNALMDDIRTYEQYIYLLRKAKAKHDYERIAMLTARPLVMRNACANPRMETKVLFTKPSATEISVLRKAYANGKGIVISVCETGNATIVARINM